MQTDKAYPPAPGQPAPMYTPPVGTPSGQAGEGGYVQQGFAAQPQPQGQMSPAQVGEEYRGQLFAQCAQGNHQPSKKYGVFGIIVAVVCFPCGLLALLVDVETNRTSATAQKRLRMYANIISPTQAMPEEASESSWWFQSVALLIVPVSNNEAASADGGTAGYDAYTADLDSHSFVSIVDGYVTDFFFVE
ncbi:hypothetical protein B0H15DRAFT_955523 [Mycena belliarum]|uniref:Transmembrane protein n=1 Tax=Mycena belliarum TaxID=1033014 RepID=A0AAD6TT18_9AGAR|nr:hypothetical protein B0H15DRAFT_955523 [Mycena belliae]